MGSRFDLRERLALVTGASRGIGRAVASALAEAGADVVLVGRDENALRTAADEVRSYGARAWCEGFDLTRLEEIEDFYGGVLTRVGQAIDVLVNCAGVCPRGPLVEFPLGEWERVLALNLTAVFELSRCFARRLIADGRRPGRIINIGSLLCRAARPQVAAYAASKGGLMMLTRAMAVEWAPHGILANAVAPGYVETDLTRPLWQDADFTRWVKARTPLGRWLKPEDIAGAVVFLASPAASAVTGQVIYVDGGWTANL